MNAQYFAQIDDSNTVIAVHVVTAEYMEANSDRYPGTWVETFIDDPNKTYAGIGMTYDPIAQNFIVLPPQPEA